MTFDTQRLIALVEGMAARKVLVIGDVILDEYLYGRADRLSREAPIPVLEFTGHEYIPGGAANPAANVAGLGGCPLQIGVIGTDESGERLKRALAERGIDPGGLVVDATRPTTTKTRIMAQMGLRFPQQIARLDRLERRPVEGETAKQVIDQIERSVPGMSALIASDYLIGLMTDSIVSALREAGRTNNALLTADAQGELGKYGGFDLVKCNASEAAAYVRHSLRGNADFAAAGKQIASELALRGGMLITRGSEGLSLIEVNGRVTHLPAPHAEEVFDTVGAGDTVLAVMTLALVAGAEYPEAAALANFAAGLVVRKVGNYAPDRTELQWAIHTWNVY